MTTTIDSNFTLISSNTTAAAIDAGEALLAVINSTLLASTQALNQPAPTTIGGYPIDKLPIDILKYGRYYNSFFASGLAALIILGGLFIYIGMKKHQRMNPMGIMFNLVLIQIMHTFRIFLVGLFFQIW
jgi:hypothetical protein